MLVTLVWRSVWAGNSCWTNSFEVTVKRDISGAVMPGFTPAVASLLSYFMCRYSTVCLTWQWYHSRLYLCKCKLVLTFWSVVCFLIQPTDLSIARAVLKMDLPYSIPFTVVSLSVSERYVFHLCRTITNHTSFDYWCNLSFAHVSVQNIQLGD